MNLQLELKVSGKINDGGLDVLWTGTHKILNNQYN